MDIATEDMKRFGYVVDHIYQGALDPAVWPEIVVHVADWMGAKNALLFTPLHPRENQGLLFSHGFEERVMALWRSKYQPLDVWVNSGLEKGVFVEGNCLLDIDLVPDEELRKSIWYREFLSIYDIPRLITGIVFDGQLPRTVPTVCSIFRGERQPRFGQIEKAKYRLLVPHLSRALGVMYRLREPELRFAASLAALDRLESGVLLIAPQGDVAYANRAARRILGKQDGLHLREGQGGSQALVASDPLVQHQLDVALQKAVSGDTLDIPHFSLGLNVPRTSRLPAYTLQFSALPEQSELAVGDTAPRAIVFLSDPTETAHIVPETLMNLFGLTLAEASLASALASGDELQAVADKLGISVNTAKTQRQALYAKTNVDNRARLTKLLMALSSHRVA